MKLRTGLFWEVSLIAVHSISVNKLRTFLTLLGIIIGVASVMIVGAGIEGGEQYLITTVSNALGSDSFTISKFPRFGHTSRDEWEEAARRNKDLSLDDMEFVRKLCPSCEEVAGEINTTLPIYYQNNEIFGTRIKGVTANYIFMTDLELAEGRFISPNDEQSSRYSCVIGADLRDELFKAVDPIGQSLKFGGSPCRVIGILEERGSAFGTSLDNEIYLPITAFLKTFGSRKSIRIRGRAADSETFEAALDEARVATRIRHKLKPNEKDDFGMASTEDINEMVGQFAGAVQMVVTPITLISLLVGGIVVMNIMLVSVTERTFEIGLRKSLGARRKDILNQFLMEAFILAACGGLIGLLLASIVAWVIEAATPIPMKIGMGYIALSIGVSGSIGIIFGIFPAYRASRLDPIIAITHER